MLITQSLRTRVRLPGLRQIAMLALLVMSTSFVITPGIRGAQAPRSLTPLQLEIEKQRQRLSSSEVDERREALIRLAGLRRAEASRVALSALADSMPIIRATAANAILSLPAEEAASALVPLLNDKDEFVRQQVAYALGATKSRTAVSPLIERLSFDKKDAVRAAAAVALGQIGDESAVVALVEVLSVRTSAAKGGKKSKGEKNEFVLRAAAHSLGQIGSRAAVPALIAALENESLASDVRRAAAKALGQIGDPAAVPALQSAALATDPYLSQIATEALSRITARRS